MTISKRKRITLGDTTREQKYCFVWEKKRVEVIIKHRRREREYLYKVYRRTDTHTSASKEMTKYTIERVFSFRNQKFKINCHGKAFCSAIATRSKEFQGRFK